MMMTYKKTVQIFILFVLIALPGQIFAQREVNVPSGFGTLNSVVNGDTTSSGERVDINTVYILSRDSLYILDGTLDVDFPLNLAASSGPGARPRIIEGVGSGGTSPDQAIRPRNDFSFKGLYVSAQDELGGSGLRIFRISADSVNAVVDDCVLDIAGQSAFRFDGGDIRMHLTNTIVSNIGTPASPENGRVFDDRGNDIDTLISENNTFFNITFRALRDGGGIIKYAKFNHNTMVNIGWGAIDLGESYTSIVKNNIFINSGFYGTVSDPNFTVNIDTVNVGGVTQTADISNNNLYNDPAIETAQPDSVSAVVNFSTLAQSFIDGQSSGSTNISENVAFTDGPSTPTDVITSYWADPSGAQPSLDTTGYANFDFAYPTSAASYTAGTGGQPLGDLNWFGLTVGINDGQVSATPNTFKLFNNYPNPFNPSTTIGYNLSKAAHVKLTIYNAIGQQVAELVNEQQNAGSYSVKWNGTNSLGQHVVSGIYFYRLNGDNFISTKKMVFLK